jgi:hypothetical protein
MGTRGAFGVRVDGVDKVGYNQFDSYPSGRGVEVLKFVRAFVAKPTFETEVYALARALKVVSDKKKPTKAQQKSLEKYCDLGVSNQTPEEWYCLLRHSHGDIAKTLECGYIEDHLSFLTDSLFCEWGYIINLDERTLEVYSGFQREPHEKGRFAATKPNSGGYYPVGLVKVYSFDKLPTDAKFIKECDPPEDAD